MAGEFKDASDAADLIERMAIQLQHEREYSNLRRTEISNLQKKLESAEAKIADIPEEAIKYARLIAALKIVQDIITPFNHGEGCYCEECCRA